MKSNVMALPRRKQVSHDLVQKVPSNVSHLASGLMVVMRIREGYELVNLIGNGDEYSNQRAIETWLMTHYPDDQLRAHVKPLASLSNALQLHIEDHYSSLEVF